MKAAITGGAGFIGSRLTEELLKHHEVKIIDNLSSGNQKNIPEEAEFEKRDIKKEISRMPLATLTLSFTLQQIPKSIRSRRTGTRISTRT
ncbi:MAG: UDP-glucose 4-epimerase [Candidatus Nanosalina sp. J07AB43]|nr:MAG: UDP-glucose 4-epimerase [Candidatus Nanosalina sp. J07AB43]